MSKGLKGDMGKSPRKAVKIHSGMHNENISRHENRNRIAKENLN